MKYGYARVSTKDQSCAIQEAALQAAGCDIIRSEKQSGRKLKNREELALLLDFIRAGDELVITRLDRLARSLPDLVKTLAVLQERGATLRCLEQPVDTSSATGRLMLNILGTIAEFETDLRSERQAEGVRAAKAAGKYNGRPPKLDLVAIKNDYSRTQSMTETAANFGVSRNSVWRACRKAPENAHKTT